MSLAWAVEGPPVGTWRTSNGSFDGVMQDILSLAPDGTGWVRTQSALRGPERFAVMWCQPAPGQLELAMLQPDDDPDEPPFFEKIGYAARRVSSDLGEGWVLQNTDDDVFWFLAGPVVLSDRLPRAPSELA